MVAEPFTFYKCLHLVVTTGRKAANLREFFQNLAVVEEESIFYHLQQAFRKYTLEMPEFPNDFAVWSAQFLQDRALAEKLADIDVNSFDNLAQLRHQLLKIVESHMASVPQDRGVPPGEEFCFNRAITFVIPTKLQAGDLEEFTSILSQIGTDSIYYHFLEAKMRVGRDNDDFSRWIRESLGQPELAGKLARIDPYQASLEELRARVLEALVR